MATSLRVISVEEATKQSLKQDPVDADTLIKAKTIVDDVRVRGDEALLEYATKFGDLKEGSPSILSKAELKAVFDSLPVEQQKLLERTALRIRAFAEAQAQSIKELQVGIAGGLAGHTVSPVDVAACYAPGGRYPLPSSVLMVRN
jgi:phosphoribosyl-ATP pyrophosphohydrolase/phosphoribosyl-AMP cyclohydrolase/histidinol dehydrogenase